MPKDKKRKKGKRNRNDQSGANSDGNDVKSEAVAVSVSESENEYLREVLEVKAACGDWNNLFSRNIEEDRRMLQWQYASTMGEPLLNKYAWAIPSNSVINILTQFSPLVEMGAGKGYWAHLVQKQGGYIMPFDITVPKKKEAWTKVHQGTPTSILSPAVSENKQLPLSNLNLFLCYPDQGSDVGLPSLEAYQTLTDCHNQKGQQKGGYIVHVGELLVTGCISGAPQAPWGRTSTPEFQERLYTDYHCVLSIPLESFPFSRDFFTVWKRTAIFDAKNLDFNGDSSEEVEDMEAERSVKKRKPNNEFEDSESEKSGIDDVLEENDDEWADIPVDERLPHLAFATAAPCMQHMLNEK